ncbi:MAG: aminoglycoside phosphotransferase family protein [Oscillospiraceae bacterium]|jgi:hypothetical protein|nr:aminoglycoside phosphotransferase family protein [Oscillospiraceae bacterium]MDD3261182.1 aminoglycoside phosphotransferase family protein [Oscillospiraceae bacterium]
MTDAILTEVIAAFPFTGTCVSVGRYGSGHINETYCAIFRSGGQRIRYILQKINTEVFPDVDGLMENITGVTAYLKEVIEKEGGDPQRGTLTVFSTRAGRPYYRAADGGCWRCYPFVEGTVSYDLVKSPHDFYTVACAFGHFQMQLSGYPAERLHETIPHFHDTPSRYAALHRALKEDKLGRAAAAQPEIAFYLTHEKDAPLLTDLLAAGRLPLRVTHNDTKLNNILLDSKTSEALCIIDLDTVMPGLVHYDFGDCIRFGASTALEDETDLSKVSLSLPLFEVFARGFLESAGSILTPEEVRTLPLGAKLMTLECGTRFLTDFLQGDTYFRVSHPLHNLERCRTQMMLVADMEKKWSRMCSITEKAART